MSNIRNLKIKVNHFLEITNMSITVTTKKAKRGKKICSFCGGEFILHEAKQIIMPGQIRGLHLEEPFDYMMEFSQCDNCGTDIVLNDSIDKNDKRLKQAKLEATVAYKMKKWLESKTQDLQ